MNLITRVGATWLRPTIESAGFAVSIGLQSLLTLPHLPRRMRATLDQMHLVGVKTMPVVLMVGFFVAVVLTVVFVVIAIEGC